MAKQVTISVYSWKKNKIVKKKRGEKRRDKEKAKERINRMILPFQPQMVPT